MDDKTIQAITVLAEKLGTTAEYLWGTLLLQAKISGCIGICSVVIFTISLIVLTRFVYKKTNILVEKKYGEYPQWEDEKAFGAWSAVAFAWIIEIAICIDVLPMAIYGLLNPGYWALAQVLK